MFDGGIVDEAIKHPRLKGSLAVRATWTWVSVGPPSKNTIIHQIKDDMFVGAWKVIGMESHSKIPRELIVIVEPDELAQSMNRGDILVLGRGAVSKYVTNSINPRPESAEAVEVGHDRLRGILSPDILFGTALHVFHNPSDDVTDHDVGFVTSSKHTYNCIFKYLITTIARYTLEFKLSGKAVPAKSIIDILAPLRDFILDASEEICLGIPRKRGRRAEADSELFEPVVTAKAASVRFRLHPSSSSRTRNLDTSKPFRLLSEVLRKANNGDGPGVLKALEESLKSVDESLKQVEAIIKTARKQKLEFSATDAPTSISLGNRAISAIRSLETVEIRSKTVQGDIYAVDLHRKWCRVSTSDTDPQEDWKLSFSDDLKEKVRGKYPRRVEVEFDTYTRPVVISGSGTLLNIKDINQ